jgi:DNA (cytosine-5)-methyltransferase 1
MSKELKVIELFAGVGGFRLGLEGWKGMSPSSGYKRLMNSNYNFVWSNQWEPSTKTQHASLIYEERFGTKMHSNEDISQVPVSSIPDHDLLVGGFPCQDYSVATTLKNSKGLIGKKGVLWWSIHKILNEKKKKPSFLFLENVDRLLISPSGQRGRDFAIILQSLNELDYAVEWRVINAADYGMPQKRKRVFILAYHKKTQIYKRLLKASGLDWISSTGVNAQAFPVLQSLNDVQCFNISGDVVSISNSFNKTSQTGLFENSGLMIKGQITTAKLFSAYDGPQKTLGDILQQKDISPEFYINESELEKWSYLKGAKKEVRVNLQGFEYNYTEGSMTFPDSLDKASRTIITGEGGNSPSRFKHVIFKDNKYRRLTPIELERLNMFPDNHTNCHGISNTKRAFLMGNALVVGVIERIGISLYNNAFL